MERALEQWHFPLYFRLFAVYVNSFELIIPVVHIDINIEKLADTRGTFWVGTRGSESLPIYTARDTFKDKETL